MTCPVSCRTTDGSSAASTCAASARFGDAIADLCAITATHARCPLINALARHLISQPAMLPQTIRERESAMAQPVPRFLRALYELVHNEDDAIVCWSADKTFFQVHDIKRMETHVLPKYFNHGKFASFQRQLNNFGFHKWTKARAAVCTFSHDKLVGCVPQDLTELYRRTFTTASRHSGFKRSRAFLTCSVASIATDHWHCEVKDDSLTEVGSDGIGDLDDIDAMVVEALVGAHHDARKRTKTSHPFVHLKESELVLEPQTDFAYRSIKVRHEDCFNYDPLPMAHAQNDDDMYSAHIADWQLHVLIDCLYR